MDLQANQNQRSLNMINTNMNHTFHENLQRTYTDEISLYQKRRDDLIANWDQRRVEAEQRFVAIPNKSDALVIEADLAILSPEQNALLDAADKIIAGIVTTAMDNVRQRYRDLIDSLDVMKLYEANTKDSLDGINSYIKSLFE